MVGSNTLVFTTAGRPGWACPTYIALPPPGGRRAAAERAAWTVAASSWVAPQGDTGERPGTARCGGGGAMTDVGGGERVHVRSAKRGVVQRALELIGARAAYSERPFIIRA